MIVVLEEADAWPAPSLAEAKGCRRLDFSPNQIASGRRFPVLDVVDNVTRKCWALAAVKGEKTLAELEQLLDVYPNQISTPAVRATLRRFGGVPRRHRCKR